MGGFSMGLLSVAVVHSLPVPLTAELAAVLPPLLGLRELVVLAAAEGAAKSHAVLES